MQRRVAFVTIGQSPRDDVLPDIIAETRTQFAITERGALDDLDDAAIADLAPHAGERRLACCAERIGILLPNAAQIEEFHGIPGIATKAAGADLIVMHCIGYSEAMRQVVKQASGRPVLVSRRIVAHAIDLVLS